jgi:hypothetical protein
VRLVIESGADLVLNALVGSAGLGPTVATLGEGIDLALANKESLVVGGELVTQLAEATGAQIIPVDSEHSALHQLIAGERPGTIDKLVLTASGGPFRGRSRGELEDVTVEEALAHPTWAMGGKITIDSATLMNKGLELIEAHHLFGTPYDAHRRRRAPAVDRALLRPLVRRRRARAPRPPDMRVPISYALHYPERVDVPVASARSGQIGALTFEPVDTEPSLPAPGARGRAPRAAPRRACSTRPTRSPCTPSSAAAGLPRHPRGHRDGARAPARRSRARLRVAARGRPRGARGGRRADRGARLSWLLAFLGFAALIILHEFGHFSAAKATGMRVERFSLFFPPLLARVRRGETEYAIGRSRWAAT